jgi:hypothetical protein
MKNLLKLEELFLLGLALFLLSGLDYPWWLYAVLFLAPDLSMLGYLGGPRLGAAVYNFVHHRGLAVACYIFGFAAGQSAVQFAGLILFGHSSFDRILGYGLKYPDAFENTHLGLIGRRKS